MSEDSLFVRRILRTGKIMFYHKDNNLYSKRNKLKLKQLMKSVKMQFKIIIVSSKIV
jgi:hypothetical protein